MTSVRNKWKKSRVVSGRNAHGVLVPFFDERSPNGEDIHESPQRVSLSLSLQAVEPVLSVTFPR